MEARMGNSGHREFIQVLRLMEDFHQHLVEQAIAEALRLGAISFDAVKMLLLAKLENRLAWLDLTFYPYLQWRRSARQTRAPISGSSPTQPLSSQVHEFRHERLAGGDLPNDRRAAGAAGQSPQGVEASPLRANRRKWRWNRRKIAPIIRAICCACANWSASIASGAMSSVAFAWRALRRSRASTHSTSPRSRHSTSRWFWSWRGANG
jgi:hypothetical protein